MTCTHLTGILCIIIEIFIVQKPVLIIVNSGKVRVALEMEYTSADFGSDYDINYIPSSTTKVSNLRALLGIYYFF